MNAQLTDFIAERAEPLGLSAAELLWRDAPGGLDTPGWISANGSCRLLEANDGWIALNLARSDDWDVVPALTGREDPSWDTLAQVARESSASDFRDRAVELQMPVAVMGEAKAQPLPAIGADLVPGKVVDLSALWAGPLCAGLLARAGAEVVRIENIARTDPTLTASPQLDARINGGKQRLALDLRTPAGREALAALLLDADVLVTSARPAALQRLGLTPLLFPHLTWVAITAYGFAGQQAQRVGFGDDCAVAGGLVNCQRGKPHFLGDALADPLTGLEAALAVLAGQRGVIDMALARVAAAYSGIIG